MVLLWKSKQHTEIPSVELNVIDEIDIENRSYFRRNANEFFTGGQVQIGENYKSKRKKDASPSLIHKREGEEIQKKYQKKKRLSLFSTAKESRASSLTTNEDEKNEQAKTSDRPLDKNDRIIINVGGIRHETFKSTIRLYPDTRLGWIIINGSESIDSYDPIRNEYFFDRHPTAFSQIVNFYRTGKLHAPSDICGPLFEEELIYWGLDETSMEPCCWSKYTEHRDAQENLKVFDHPMLNAQDEKNERLSRYDKALSNSRGSSNPIIGFIKRFQPKYFNSAKWLNWKRNVWLMFEDPNSSNSSIGKLVSIISLTFILLSVISLCFYSMLHYEIEAHRDANPKNLTATLLEKKVLDLNRTYEILLICLDGLCCLWFTMEFFLRFISAPNRTHFIFDLMNIFDLMTIIPYFVNFASTENYIHDYNLDSTVLQIMSISRLFRLFRFFRLSTGLQILKHTMIASSKELLLLLLLLLIPVAIFATIIYYCERDVEETKFRTIPESFWWAIITMTTVGYGDMSPTTTTGKVFGAICATCSVLILALPVSVIGNNFTLFYHYAQARLKLPKRQQNALVGAANALIAESSRQAIATEDEDDPDIKGDEDDTNDMLNGDILNGDILNGDMQYSNRFRRERLSLYTNNSPRRTSSKKKSVVSKSSDERKDSYVLDLNIIEKSSFGEVNSSYENSDEKKEDIKNAVDKSSCIVDKSENNLKEIKNVENNNIKDHTSQHLNSTEKLPQYFNSRGQLPQRKISGNHLFVVDD